ncbi:S1 family peptidase [Polyangium aurulentum]|uniref:S1 family peptidase n=1 Tax=Polyangium aurulentum TaxID=2567896 RepID=UPI0010ADFB7B|nr:trypsin-like serine protease [Polyangium aurulentum]UQA59380.1 trypsin-like serine protease [Polyangium aurulentum]
MLRPRQLRPATLIEKGSKGAFCCALLLTAGCALEAGSPQEGVGTAEQKIAGGILAPDDPAIVGLEGAGKIGCTGVLVSPRVVLTAAHCLDGDVIRAVLFGSSADGGDTIGVLRGWKHPDHQTHSANHDLGLLLLDAPSDVPPLPLNHEPLTSANAGAHVRIVGFGQTGMDDTAAPRKRQGTSILASVSPSTLTIEPSPARPCVGDSGGPVLQTRGEREVIVGIVSKGAATGADRAEAARVDAALEGFLRPLLAMIEATSGELGDPCALDDNCGAGLCLSPEDAPSFAYCSRPCATSADCLPDMECAPEGPDRHVCRYDGPSPGALGAPCQDHGGCEFGLCAVFAADAPAICSALCFPEDERTCPHGGECTLIPGTDGTFGCAIREEEGAPEGGCSCATPPGARESGDGVVTFCWAALTAAWIRRKGGGRRE